MLCSDVTIRLPLSLISPNGIGSALGGVQMVLCVLFSIRKKDQEKDEESAVDEEAAAMTALDTVEENGQANDKKE